MLKRMLSQLHLLFGAGVPAVWSMSVGRLIGMPGGDDKGVSPPASAEEWIGMARAYAQMGHYEQAQKALAKSDEYIRASTPHTPGFESLAKVRIRLGEEVRLKLDLKGKK